MRAIGIALLIILSLALNADNKDPLYIDTDLNHKFSLKEQVNWTQSAIMEYESLRTSPSLKTKKRLYLIISSDVNENGSIDEREKRLIRGRLASICSYYESVLQTFYKDGKISSYNLKKLKYKFPDMIPGYDLADPFTDDSKIRQELSPIYF